MSKGMFEVDAEGLFKALRAAPSEIRRVTRSEMNRTARAIALEARARVPSGMQKGATGIRYRASASNGFILEALGTDKAPAGSPKSWMAAAEQGPWKHPVWDSRKPAKRWSKEPQPPVHMLERTFEENREAIISRVAHTLALALSAVGFEVSEGKG